MKMSDINILDELRRPGNEELGRIFNRRSVKKGEIAYRPDDAGNLVFLVETGRFRAFLGYEDKEFTMGYLEPGDIFSSHAGCFIKAQADGALLVTDVHSVKRLMAETPVFTRNMVRILGQMLKNSFSVIEGLVFKDIQLRLAELLVREARRAGRPLENGAYELHLAMTAEQLAKLVGGTRQTVSTLLNNLMREGLLEKRDRATWIIPDLDALANLSKN